jgi:hypothetical protein
METPDTQPSNGAEKPIDVEPIKPLKADLSKACFDLAGDLPMMMRNWSKITRMGLGRKLEEHTYKLLDSAVVVSNPSVTQQVKLSTLEAMSSGSDAVLVYLRLGYQGKEIDGKRYQRLSTQVVAIGKQVGGLRKYLERNRSGKPQSV